MLSELKASRLFRECTDRELEKVASVCETETFAAGETVFKADAPAHHVYIVGEGSVDLRFAATYYAASQEITLDRKFKGDVLGWSAIVEPHAFTLSAVAVRNSTLLKILGSDLTRFCAEDDHFGYVFMRNMAHLIGQRFNIAQRMLIDVVQDRLRKQEPGG